MVHESQKLAHESQKKNICAKKVDVFYARSGLSRFNGILVGVFARRNLARSQELDRFYTGLIFSSILEETGDSG